MNSLTLVYLLLTIYGNNQVTCLIISGGKNVKNEQKGRARGTGRGVRPEGHMGSDWFRAGPFCLVARILFPCALVCFFFSFSRVSLLFLFSLFVAVVIASRF